MSYVYIGTKQSDLDIRDKFFQHSIVYYGNPKENSSVYSNKIRLDNKYEKPFINFVIKEMKRQIIIDSKCQFIFYSNKLAWRIIQFDESLKPYVACLNPLELLNSVDNKIIFRAWFYTKARSDSYKVMNKQNIEEIPLVPDISYVIQEGISAGGEGTYLWNIFSKDYVYHQLSSCKLYLITNYLDGVSISCTIICYSKNTIVFPPNVQNVSVSKDTGYRILFEGSDFVEGSKLPQEIKLKIRNKAKTVGRELSQMGYRGICGIDFMWYNNALLIMEVNPRFLGSSFLIDTALIDNGLPTLAHLHTSAFYETPLNNEIIYEIENIKIPYYSRVVTNRGGSTETYAKMVLNTKNANTTFFMDGFSLAKLKLSGPDAYLFRMRGTVI